MFTVPFASFSVIRLLLSLWPLVALLDLKQKEERPATLESFLLTFNNCVGAYNTQTGFDYVFFSV